MKQQIEKYKVKRIVWNVAKTGKLRPLLQLTKTFDIGGLTFDGLMTEVETVESMNIGKSSIIRVVFDNREMIDIKSVYKPVRSPVPAQCPTCDHNVVDHYCTNPVCPSKGLTPIVKLLIESDVIMSNSVAETIIKEYCANFPVNQSETSTVSDLLDYLILLDPKRDLNTNARMTILKQKFPQSHSVLFDLEQMVQRWFTIKNLQLGVEPEKFWDTLTLVGFSETDYAILRKISPVGENLIHTCMSQHMSKKGIQTLMSIDPLIARLIECAKIDNQI